jgi:hypothetical protein
MVGAGGMLRTGQMLSRLAQPRGGDAFGCCSPSLEVWLRSLAYSLTNLSGKSPKSRGLGNIDVLHAVSSLEASPGECGAQ